MLPDHDNDDRPVEVDAPEVPASVRQAVAHHWKAGDTLWRCPRRSAPQGSLGVFGVGKRSVVIEWWHIDADGELVDVYWPKN